MLTRLLIRLHKEKKPEYPLAKAIGEDFILVSRKELEIR